MVKLNWSDFDGNIFQRFCNALLMYEVSKFAHVFSAPGSDGGIDQLYDGYYEQKNGLWRFQDKFHNSGSSAADSSALKRDVINDIECNYGGENYLVIITNVNPNPNKYKEILKVGNDLLKKLNYACELLIWHEAKIEALLSQYTILYHQFWGRESILLQPYEDYFKHPLQASNSNFRYQLSNYFFGREQDIDDLENFVLDSSTHALAIIANGGYGKTRLCIEFFKKKISNYSDWIIVVLSHGSFAINEFAQLLNIKRRLLILVDNAHEIPNTVNEVKRLIDNSGGHHKLIITTRKTLFSEIIEKLPSHSRNIQKIFLKTLSYEKTKEMILYELPNIKDQYVIHLAQISKGVPNVILELINLIKNGKQPSELSSVDSFNESVEKIFNEAANHIQDKTAIPKNAILEFVKVITLISPITNGEKSKSFIGQIINLRNDQIELIIENLFDLGLLENGYTITIKPDPYSDTILNETIKKNRGFIEHVRKSPGAEIYLENILKNLSEADIGDNEKNAFIDSLISNYINQVDTRPIDISIVRNVYDFVEKIAFNKPQIALNIVSSFFTIPVDEIREKDYEHLKDKASKILHQISCHQVFGYTHKAEIYYLAEKIDYEKKDVDLLKKCFVYHEWDFPYWGYKPRSCSEKQLFLKQIICQKLSDNTTDKVKVEMAIKSAAFLLNVEFKLQEFYEHATGAFHFGTGYVPYCKHIKEIRFDLIDALLNIYTLSFDDDIRKEVMNVMRHFFYYACTSSDTKQDLNEEVVYVLDFFDKRFNKKTSVREKCEISEIIYTFSRGEIKTEYQKIIDSIRIKATRADSLYEELEMLILNTNYFDQKENLKPKLSQIIDQYESFNKFSIDLVEIRLRYECTSSYSEIINHIASVFDNESKVLFQTIMDEFPLLVPESLNLIRKFYYEEEFFQNIIDWLWLQRDKYIGALIWLITWGRNKDRKYYKLNDLDYFEFALNENITSLYNQFASIIDYAYLDSVRTFDIINKYFARAHHNVHGEFFYVVFDEKQQYYKDFKNELYDFYFDNFKIVESSNVQIDRLYKFIENEFDFDKLIFFLKNKINKELQEQPYLSYRHKEFYHNEEIPFEVRLSRFIDILLQFVYSNNEDKTYKCLLSIFRFNNSLPNDLYVCLLPHIETFKEIDKLIKLAKGLIVFSEITVEWIHCMATICQAAMQCDASFNNFTDIFGTEFRYNSGSKSKHGRNVPYIQDIARKSLLENVIRENNFGTEINFYLERCLEKVNLDIEREITKDSFEEEW